MDAIPLLDGLQPGPLATAVRATLTEAGALGPVHSLGREVLAPCQGCWGCWVEHPGTCKTADGGNAVMRDVIGASAVLWTTEVRYGCWGAATKAALDRSLGILSPFFKARDGETRHHRRYASYPRWGVLGVVGPEVSRQEQDTFRRLVYRNTLNVYAGPPWVGLVPADAAEADVRELVLQGLVHLGGPQAPAPVPAAIRPAGAVGPAHIAGRPRHVVVWVGSAKPKGTSSSEALGRHLAVRLERRGWTSEVVYAAAVTHLSRAGAPRLVEAFMRADLVILASPVYFDALPALVLHGLDALAGAELGPARPALLPIIQCGFPELSHTEVAVSVARHAADLLRLGWAGHLAMGGGGALGGKPLSSLGGRARPQVEALEAAAHELDAGRPISAATSARFAQAVLTPGLYRAIGQLGWVVDAARRGGLTQLWRRPFPAATAR
ncbi:MAG: flavodoxin family protein [Deltaproteobacteria bacterium]|nr:flavodoxin family protein [Deltaproteobacteria bacterium]